MKTLFPNENDERLAAAVTRFDRRGRRIPANKIRSLMGMTFGRITVLRQDGFDRFHRAAWWCRCVCGKEKRILGYYLTTGDTKSCGCLHDEVATTRIVNLSTTHGATHTVEFTTWSSMLRRCYDQNMPKFHLWGGRSITVCDRWRNSFENFLADMGKRPGPKLSLDRIDNDGNYEPGNCRWATWSQQLKNRRKYTRRYTGKRATLRPCGGCGAPTLILCKGMCQRCYDYQRRHPRNIEK